MSPDDTFDLDGYLARIGYAGPRTPTLETLRAIQLLHPQAIPFENLNPLLALPVPLDIGALQDKLVRSQRGGYCFEHNTLLLHALRAIGFRVTGLAGRVVWNQVYVNPPRSHMILRVELEDGIWLADTGFGMSPTGPLRLAAGHEQKTPHESFRLVEEDDHFTLQARLAGIWTSFYRFDLQRQEEIDYAVANYYVSTHPTSHFVKSIIAARATPGGRYGLRNNRLSMHRTNSPSEQRVLASAAELRDVLHELFGIAVPEPERFDARVTELNLLAPA